MTNTQKQEILSLVDAEKNRLGSYRAVANKCGISETAISQIRSGQYNTDGDDMWHLIALKLGYNPSGWVVVPTTTNYRMIAQVLADAKANCMFMAISHKAGSGKTGAINSIVPNDESGSVYKLQCREWGKKDFLLNLAIALGVDVASRAMSIDKMGQEIIDFFNQRAFKKPQLILDEADKLKPTAKRFLIPLYNGTEDGFSLVAVGTENLEKEIKAGAKNSVKGYDELDSRFGRAFIHLIGNTKADVYAICEANGIPSAAVKASIWKELKPTTIIIEDKSTHPVQKVSIEIVEDTRRIKRSIQRELLKSINNN